MVLLNDGGQNKRERGLVDLMTFKAIQTRAKQRHQVWNAKVENHGQG